MKEATRAGQRPVLIVLSGPSGAGKDAVLSRMKELGIPFHYVVTATTRPRRPGEIDGTDYLFLTSAELNRMRSEGELLETAEVYGNWYGVPKKQVEEALREGKDVILKVDVQGASTIRKLIPGAVLIFLTLPSTEEYERRLRQRKTESEQALKVRLSKALDEMKNLPMFDYVVVNNQGELDSAVSQIAAIVTAEKCRVHARTVEMSF
jgi:guanylate kinase